MERKHNHYFKDVSKLTEIDVYRTCERFNVQDPSGAVHHAIKKLLLAGGRGAGKDYRKDIQEAYDTLGRKLEMMDEDELSTVAQECPSFKNVCLKHTTGVGPCYCDR